MVVLLMVVLLMETATGPVRTKMDTQETGDRILPGSMERSAETQRKTIHEDQIPLSGSPVGLSRVVL